MKQLPLGTQSFEILRSQDYIYVDKTKYIFELINDGEFIFFLVLADLGNLCLSARLKNCLAAAKNYLKGFLYRINEIGTKQILLFI